MILGSSFYMLQPTKYKPSYSSTIRRRDIHYYITKTLYLLDYTLYINSFIIQYKRYIHVDIHNLY